MKIFVWFFFLLILVSCRSTVDDSVDTVLLQAIQYKDAVMKRDVYVIDSLNNVISPKSKMIGVVFIQHHQGLITLEEENRLIELIINN